MFELRDYQEELLQSIRACVRQGKRRVLAVMPTGSGKGVTIAALVAAAAAKGRRVWVIAHRAELVEDLSGRLARCEIEHGIVASGKPLQANQMVQVASVQTLVRRLDKLPAPDIIIQDEAHHAIAGNTWGKVIERYPDALLIGKTATPERLDGKGLGVEAGGFFEEMVLGPSAEWLTDNGYLAPAKFFCPPVKLSRKLGRRGVDYAMDEAADEFGRREIVGDVIEHYRRHMAGKTAIAFCCTVKHAEQVAAEFNAAGIAACSLDGSMSTDHRRQVLADLASGAVKVVTSCMIISEGTDVPSVGGCILLRPTMSLALHLQMLGRCLRPKADGSHAVVLDHVGNVAAHGFPTDLRAWSLLGRKDRQATEREQAPSVRQCPSCFAALPGGTPVCPECGHPFSAEEIQEIETVVGELQEVTPKGLRPGDPVILGGFGVASAAQELNPSSAEAPSGLWYVAGKANSRGIVQLCRCPHDARAVASGRARGIESYTARLRWLSPAPPVEGPHRPRRASSGAGTLSELRDVAARRGYSPGWADKVWAARNRGRRAW